jgi:hypothetical protein
MKTEKEERAVVDPRFRLSGPVPAFVLIGVLASDTGPLLRKGDTELRLREDHTVSSHFGLVLSCLLAKALPH